MSRGGKARQTGLQLDMFHNADPLVGIEINLPRHCQCGHEMLHVGPGGDPHRASLQCARCGRHCGWLSHKAAKFLSDVIGRFGKPVAPVRVHVPRTKPNLHFVDNGEASIIAHSRAPVAVIAALMASPLIGDGPMDQHKDRGGVVGPRRRRSCAGTRIFSRRREIPKEALR
jgi:hypothetical protein